MGKKEFDDFLRREEEIKKPTIDWDAEKNGGSNNWTHFTRTYKNG